MTIDQVGKPVNLFFSIQGLMKLLSFLLFLLFVDVVTWGKGLQSISESCNMLFKGCFPVCLILSVFQSVKSFEVLGDYMSYCFLVSV